MTDYNWTAAVDSLFARAGDLKPDAIAARTGVSPGTVRRWRRLRDAKSEIPEPRGAARGVLLQALDEREGRKRLFVGEGDVPVRGEESGVAEGVPSGALDSFWQRVDEIHALPISEGMKILRVDALAAAIRAEYARQAESAAEARARAVERAESGAEARAKAIERAEESARDRARALGERGTSGANQQQLVDEVLRALTERDEAAAKERDRNLQ